MASSRPADPSSGLPRDQRRFEFDRSTSRRPLLHLLLPLRAVEGIQSEASARRVEEALSRPSLVPNATRLDTSPTDSCCYVSRDDWSEAGSSDGGDDEAGGTLRRADEDGVGR